MKTARKFSPLIPVLAVLVGVVTAFWAPTLFGGKTLVHGDSLLHGLSLWRYNVANVGSPENLVWDKYTYGGHPLFAEGQGGFAFLCTCCSRAFRPRSSPTILRTG